MFFPEYASNGSLYAYLQNPESTLDFEWILQWSKEIALGINLVFFDIHFFGASSKTLKMIIFMEASVG